MRDCVRHLQISWVIVLLMFFVMSCLRPAEDRTQYNTEVGQSTAHGLSIGVEGGLATVQGHVQGALTLWAQAPVLRVRAVRSLTGAQDWQITMRNVLPDVEVTAVNEASGAAVVIQNLARPIPTEVTFSVSLAVDEAINISLSPPDVQNMQPWRFAVLSDVQSGIGEVEDIYRRMNEDAQIRFVLSSGDLVSQGVDEQLIEFQDKLKTLNVPFYSTLGNHELFDTGGEPWFRLFGRSNFYFAFRGIHFSLVDSGNSTVDPPVYDWLRGWLEQGAGAVHIFVTHYAPLDPVGPRNSGFKSRREAAKMLKMLAEYSVDAAFFGHIHSFYQFSSANIPSYISGGGGAIPEQLDGVSRHYLVVDVEPMQNRVSTVGLVRVD